MVQGQLDGLKASPIEKCFAAFALLLASGAVFPLLFGLQEKKVEGSAGLQALWFCVYIVMAIAFVKRNQSYMKVFAENKAIGLLLLLGAVSVSWSALPALTLRRTVALAGTMMLGVYLGSKFSNTELLRLLAVVFAACMLFSGLFAVFAPSFAYHTASDAFASELVGTFRGAFNHKNALGSAMALAVVVYGYLFFSARGPARAAYFAFGLAAGALLFASQSNTAWVVLIATVAAVPLIKARSRVRKYKKLFASVAAGIVLASLYLFVTNLESVLDAFGKDVTLTGRLPLWIVLSGSVAERPGLGYGYGIFWSGWDAPGSDVWSFLKWQVPHAHNGFLDLALDLGLAGVAVFLAAFFIVLRKALAAAGERQESNQSWPLVFLIFFFLVNLAESSILRYNSLFWVLFTAVAVRLSDGGEA